MDIWIAGFECPFNLSFTGCCVTRAQGAGSVQESTNDLHGAREVMHVDWARKHREVRGSAKATLALVWHSLSKSERLEWPLRKLDLATQDNAVSCGGPCNFDCCLYIGAAAGLLAEAAKAMGTVFPCCQNKDVVSSFFFDRKQLSICRWTALVASGGGVCPGSLSRVVVHPVREKQPGWPGFLFSDGACTCVPLFVHFLCYPRAGRKHNPPLVDARYTGSVRSSAGLVKLADGIPKAGQETFRESSSQWSDERSMIIHLILTTLAGEETQLTIELQEFDRLQEFESAVLEQLPEIGESSTFGCELDFVCRNSQQKLVGPIWHTLRDCNCFTVISSVF